MTVLWVDLTVFDGFVGNDFPFRVGCDFLAELLDKYPVEEALTAYNSGSPGTSSYSQSVIEIYEKWKELVGDEVSGIKG